MPSNLPACNGNALLTASLVADLSTLKDISPLGHTNSNNGNSGHVLPVNHLYLDHYGPPADANGSPIEIIPLTAPGDIEVYQVYATDHVNSAGVHTLSDSKLYFATCKDVAFWVDHVQNLNPTITTAMQAVPKTDCRKNVMDNLTYNSCVYNITLRLKSGTSIGQGGADFGAVDYRIKPQTFIRPDSQQYLYSVCGLSYFTEPYKTQMYKKLDNTKIDASGLPDCGTDMWDQAGTIQGNWFLPNTPKNGGYYDPYALVIIPLNTDPSQGNIDWGSGIAPADHINFLMQNSGTLNRNLVQVTTDGKVYCFQDTAQGVAYARSVILQLVDDSTLKAQYHSGVCPYSPTLTSPTTYIR